MGLLSIEVGSHEAVSINGGPFTYYVITNGEGGGGLSNPKKNDYVMCERSLKAPFTYYVKIPKFRLRNI